MYKRKSNNSVVNKLRKDITCCRRYMLAYCLHITNIRDTTAHSNTIARSHTHIHTHIHIQAHMGTNNGCISQCFSICRVFNIESKYLVKVDFV